MSTDIVIREARILAGANLDEVDGDLLIEAGRIAKIGRVTASGSASNLEARGAYILPGLIDAHVHFGITGSVNAYEFWKSSYLDRSLAMYRNGLLALLGGITTVRDLGAVDYGVIDYSRLVANDRLIGPSVVPAGQLIAMTGGHGWTWGREADGPDGVRRAVREQIKAGALVIKLMATGGLSTPGNAHSPELTLAELTAGVEEAHKAGLRATAHAHNPAGVRAAVEAGVDSVEHAAFAGDDEFTLMLSKSVCLVPTLVAVDFIQPGSGVDEEVVSKTAAAVEPFRNSVRRAITLGVDVVAGTDAGTSLNPIGRLVDEIGSYTELGMSQHSALLAATVRAGRLLGVAAGVIDEGRPADLLVLSGDPREDLSVLRDPQALILRGNRVDSKWLRATVSSLPRFGPAPESLAAMASSWHRPRHDRI